MTLRVLHVSADYPDPLAPAKTRAVANLLALVPEHAHKVYSLNRVGWRLGVHALDFADAAGAAHRALAYGAPPKGMLLAARLDRVADWILADARAAGFIPDVIHAHKLSMEGLVGERLADAFDAPLILSIQGNSDLRIVGARPDLRSRWRRIWRRATVALPFAPWAAQGLEALLGPRPGPTRPLPCPGPADALIAPRATGPVIRTAFNLSGAANKNAAGLIRAVALAAREAPGIALEIIGGGDPQAFAALDALASSTAPGRVRFLGPAPQGEIQTLFNDACAFAMVSHRESYGMVYAEALLAGAPCLISRGRGFDGYFPDGDILLAVDPADDAAIAAALARLVLEQDAFKARLAARGAAGDLDILRRPAIAATYRAALAA